MINMDHHGSIFSADFQARYAAEWTGDQLELPNWCFVGKAPSSLTWPSPWGEQNEATLCLRPVKLWVCDLCFDLWSSDQIMCGPCYSPYLQQLIHLILSGLPNARAEQAVLHNDVRLQGLPLPAAGSWGFQLAITIWLWLTVRHGKWPIEIMVYLLKMVIFHGHVK